MSIQVANVSFAEAVLLRPQMYTLNGTYEEVVAFLEGYHSGAAKADPGRDAAQEWVSFRHWLAQRLEAPSSDVFARLRQEFDGPDALAKMAGWYAEFAGQHAARK